MQGLPISVPMHSDVLLTRAHRDRSESLFELTVHLYLYFSFESPSLCPELPCRYGAVIDVEHALPTPECGQFCSFSD